MLGGLFPESIFGRKLNPNAERRLRLSQARGEETIIRAHVDNALMFVDTLAEDLSFDRAIDTSDIPERTDWSSAEIGKFYRPLKQQVTLRIDADVLAWFKAQGGKYQTAVNAALREYVERRGKAG